MISVKILSRLINGVLVLLALAIISALLYRVYLGKAGNDFVTGSVQRWRDSIERIHPKFMQDRRRLQKVLSPIGSSRDAGAKLNNWFPWSPRRVPKGHIVFEARTKDPTTLQDLDKQIKSWG